MDARSHWGRCERVSSLGRTRESLFDPHPTTLYFFSLSGPNPQRSLWPSPGTFVAFTDSVLGSLG